MHGNGLERHQRRVRTPSKLVGRERRERVSQLAWCGEGCLIRAAASIRRSAASLNQRSQIVSKRKLKVIAKIPNYRVDEIGWKRAIYKEVAKAKRDAGVTYYDV